MLYLLLCDIDENEEVIDHILTIENKKRKSTIEL